MDPLPKAYEPLGTLSFRTESSLCTPADASEYSRQFFPVNAVPVVVVHLPVNQELAQHDPAVLAGRKEAPHFSNDIPPQPLARAYCESQLQHYHQQQYRYRYMPTQWNVADDDPLTQKINLHLQTPNTALLFRC